MNNGPQPTKNRDILFLQMKMGCNKNDIAWLLGQYMANMGQIKQEPDSPVRDPSIGIFVRLINEFGLNPFKMPSPLEFYEYINDIRPMTRRQFAMLFGREESSAHRWFARGGQWPTVLRHMAVEINRLLEAAGTDEERRAIVDRWWHLAEAEAEARGIEVNREVGLIVWRKTGRGKARKAAEGVDDDASAGVDPPVIDGDLDDN
jgi:hypothetical protein